MIFILSLAIFIAGFTIWCGLDDIAKALQLENSKLRRALKVYASSKSWRFNNKGYPEWEYVDSDPTEIAREALKLENKKDGLRI